ncbi:MAG: hypothetical protein LBV79_09830 [Candidatus Adiutrix sp.]|nr:hypothetical protein [Candidatus Adiutrix sp.]
MSLADFLALGHRLDKEASGEPAPMTAEAGTLAEPSHQPEAQKSDAYYFYLALKAHIQRDSRKAKNKDELAAASGVDRKLLNSIYLGQKEASRSTQEALALGVDAPLEDMIQTGRRLAGQAANMAAPHRRHSVVQASDFKMRPLSVFGLAACGMAGWERKMPVSISASPLTFSPDAFVVIATGQSMVPAGISSGMFCYCDPAVEPIEGDAVFIYSGTFNACTIKLFVGWGEEAGTRPGWVKLRGWHDPDQWNRQRDFFMELPPTEVKEIATIICVRRRM